MTDTDRRTRPPAAGTPPRRLGGVVDVVLAAASATTVTLATLVTAEPGTEPSPLAAYLLGTGLGSLLLFRRRRPVLVLVLSVVVVMGYNLTDLPGIPPVWSLLVPLYTVARHGRVLIGVAVGAPLQVISAGWVLSGDTRSLELLDAVFRETAVLAVVLVAGAALRNKELFVQEFAARLTAERERQKRESARRILAERLRIARELHDVTAHTIAVVGVQINLAHDLLLDDPVAAQRPLETARQLNNSAVGELEAAVRLLRVDHGEPELHPMPDESQIRELLDRAAQTGLTVEFDERGTPRPISRAAGLTLYRIAQESVTNVLRHANARTLRVTLRYDAAGVALDVVDDGTGGRTADQRSGSDRGVAGYGLNGMRERAGSVGGTLTAGPGPGGGFAVHAWLPDAGTGTTTASGPGAGGPSEPVSASPTDQEATSDAHQGASRR